MNAQVDADVRDALLDIASAQKQVEATIYGFELRNATIGITSQTWENAMVRCRITGMRESGITCVGHLPKIEDNIIVFNKGSGIQGWDLQAIAGTIASSINHNTIAFNGNNGIALEGNCRGRRKQHHRFQRTVRFEIVQGFRGRPQPCK